MSTISVSFSKELAPDNSVSMRTLGTFTHHFQLALNRVYLDVRYGKVEKYSRMSAEDYKGIDYWFKETRAGSLIADFISDTDVGVKIAKRFSEIVEPTYQLLAGGTSAVVRHKREYLELAKAKIISGNFEPDQFSALLEAPPAGFTNTYTEKTTLRNLSTAITPLRVKNLDGQIDITIVSGGHTDTFSFDKAKSFALQRFVSSRQYLDPVRYHGQIFEMDSSKHSGMFHNIDNSRRQQKLIFSSEEDFNQVNFIFSSREDLYFFGMPCVESGALDLNSGDVLFVGIANV
jgi:hypothetical protein